MSRPTSARPRLARAALRLVEQAGVLQRHAHAGADGGEQTHVRVAIGVVALHVLQGDEPEQSGRWQRSARARPSGSSRCPRLRTAPRPGIRPGWSRARPGGPREPRSNAFRPRRRRSPPAAVSAASHARRRTAGESGRPARRSQPRTKVPAPNTSTQLVADQIDDGLEVELGGHAFLDAVDDGELVRALLDERRSTPAAPRCAARPSARGPATTARCRARRRPGSRACPGGRGRIRGTARTRRRGRRRGSPAAAAARSAAR